LNLEVLSDWLVEDKSKIVLLCAGWKDNINIEDTLFAGALASMVNRKADCIIDCDSTLMAIDLYHEAEGRLSEYLKKSSHYKRLSNLHHEEDMVYCLQHSVIETIVGLKDGEMQKV